MPFNHQHFLDYMLQEFEDQDRFTLALLDDDQSKQVAKQLEERGFIVVKDLSKPRLHVTRPPESDR